MDVIVKRFDNPDELRSFTKGTFEIVHIAGNDAGCATWMSLVWSGPSRMSDGRSAKRAVMWNISGS